MNNFLKSLFLISLIVLSYVSCKSPKDATNSHEDPKENTNGLTENSEGNTNGSTETQKEEANYKGIEVYAGTWYNKEGNSKIMTIYSNGSVTFFGNGGKEHNITNITKKSDTNFILYYEDTNGNNKALVKPDVIFLSDTSGTITTIFSIMYKDGKTEEQTSTINIVKK